MTYPLLPTLLLLFQPSQSLPTHKEPLRNTFVVAVETVIDDASVVDVKSNDTRFNSQMQELSLAKDNLNNMAEDDREKSIVTEANDLVFAVSACRIQAKDGTPTEQCEAQVNHARIRAMEAINKHKSGGNWVDGPPA